MIPTRYFAAGLALAGVTWTAAFRGRSRFWEKMTAGVGALAVLSLVANPELRKARPRPSDLGTGLASAALLYGIFQVGDRLSRMLLPSGARDIDSVYQRRGLAPRWFIAAALGLVIGPGEELFWRGLVNRYLMQRLGKLRGSLAGSAIYGAIHTVTGNLTLTGAASVAGGFWSLQYLMQDRMPSSVISHAVWDVWIFLVQPTAVVEGA